MSWRFFFVLSQWARLSASIVFFDRPLVAALGMGLVTNALAEALALGLVLELFWIDRLRLGTVVPPSATLSFLLLFPFCLLFDWHEPEQIPLPLLTCILFAHVSAALERWLRRCNAAQDTALEQWIEDPTSPSGMSVEKYVWNSHWRVVWSSATLYVVSFFLLYALFTSLISIGAMVQIPGLTWNILYGIGLLGAVLALRTRRSYAVLAMGVVMVLVLLVL